MILVVHGQQVDSRGLPLLGEGGEARVLEHQGEALKLWHRADPARWQHLAQLPPGLPPELILPDRPVQSTDGEIVGFTMPRVQAIGTARQLGRPSWRKAHRFDPARIQALFQRLVGVLDGCHARGLILGDLNDGNVLITADGPRVIDVDSAQFGGQPCPVGHERFLPPELYGLDLAARPVFTAESDHYALAVMLFQALLSVHPFGGVHPSWPGLTQRAKAGVSALSPGVKLPPIAQDPRIVPEVLTDWFRAVFEQGLRGPLPSHVLGIPWGKPASTGPTVLVHSHGRCRSELLARTSGLFVEVQSRGALRHLRWEDGCLLREDGQRLLDCELPQGLVARLDGASTWLALGDQVRQLGPAGARRLQTSSFLGAPQLAVGPRGAVVLHQDQLLGSDGRRLGRASSGRSWLAHGPSFGLVFARYGELSCLSVLRGGLQPVQLPPIQGALLDLSASFDRTSVLLSLRLDRAGQQVVQRLLLDDHGRLLGQSCLVEDSQPQACWVPGALRGDRVLLAGPEGLLQLRPVSGLLEPTRLFPDTRPVLQGVSGLLLSTGGAICAVTNHEIRRISVT